MNKQYSVKLVQAAGFYSIKINGQQVWQVNSGSAKFQNVKYYGSDMVSFSRGGGYSVNDKDSARIKKNRNGFGI